MARRELTQDVKFYQLSTGMIFVWRGNAYVRREKNFAERRTDDTGSQLKFAGPYVEFQDDEIVMISNKDENDLRFKERKNVH